MGKGGFNAIIKNYMNPKFSLIIPTYNRNDVLIQNLREIRSRYPEAEIIVIDDGSKTDVSLAIKKEFSESIIFLKNEENLGKGASLRKGFLKAQGDYLIFTDDDLPYGTDNIELVLKKLEEGNRIVIAQRVSFSDSSFFRKIGRFCFKIFFKPLLGIKIKDTQAGLKGFQKDIGKLLFNLSFTNRFAIDLEILYLASRLKIPIEAIPVEAMHKQDSTFKFINTFDIALAVFKIKFHHYSYEKK